MISADRASDNIRLVVRTEPSQSSSMRVLLYSRTALYLKSTASKQVHWHFRCPWRKTDRLDRDQRGFWRVSAESVISTKIKSLDTAIILQTLLNANVTRSSTQAVVSIRFVISLYWNANYRGIYISCVREASKQNPHSALTTLTSFATALHSSTRMPAPVRT